MNKTHLIKALKEILEVCKEFGPEDNIVKRATRKLYQIEHSEDHIEISENDFFWAGPGSVDDTPCSDETKNKLRAVIAEYNKRI